MSFGSTTLLMKQKMNSQIWLNPDKKNPSESLTHPVSGRHTPHLGSTAVMVGNGNDLKLLRKITAMKVNTHRQVYMSHLYTDDKPQTGISLVGPFIGAPYAVMLLESLVAWGAKQIVFWGWCGAISSAITIGDIVLPTGAIVDEGTSRHYRHVGDFPVGPTTDLFAKLKTTLENIKCVFHEGIVWTTDGVFRETREKVVHFQKKDVLAVEMELSAVFTAAHYHHIDVCAVLVVSDELSHLKWHPGFRDRHFLEGRKQAGRIVVKLCQILQHEQLTPVTGEQHG